MTEARHGERGVTLIEMLIVTRLIALMAGISFPAVSAGLESMRLNAAARGISSLLNAGINRVERREEVVQFVLVPAENIALARSLSGGFDRQLMLPDGVTIEGVLPAMIEPDESVPNPPRSFILYPGAATPAIGVLLKSRRGDERQVQVDPITGVPSITNPQQKAEDSQ
jgi:prepilin-type N-terminal cleavage/methylation domain-containing protein